MELLRGALVTICQHLIKRFDFGKFDDFAVVIDQVIIVKTIERHFAKVHYACLAALVSALFFVSCVLGILFAVADHTGVKCLEVAHGCFLLIHFSRSSERSGSGGCAVCGSDS